MYFFTHSYSFASRLAKFVLDWRGLLARFDYCLALCLKPHGILSERIEVKEKLISQVKGYSSVFRLFVKIFSVLLVLSSSSLQAVSPKGFVISAFGMLNVSQTKSTTVISDAHLGYGGGLSLERRLGNTFGVELGLAFIQRVNGYAPDTVVSTNHILAPLLLNLHFGAFKIGVGGYGAMGLGTLKMTSAGVASTPTYTEAGIKTLDYGAAASAGINLGRLFLEVRYTYGIANVDSTGATTTTYNDMQGLAGFRF